MAVMLRVGGQHFAPAARLALLVAGLLVPALLAAAGAASDPGSAEALETVREPFPARAPETPGSEQPMDVFPDACDWDIEDDPLQEAAQDVLRGMSCHTFRWFDGLFGDSMDFPEEQVNGLVTTGAQYSEYDGFEPRLRLRVRAPLPNLDNRWDVLLGRVDEEAFISDTQTQDRVFYNPGLVQRENEPSWLLGLGHRRKSEKRGWDWSAGVRLRFPPVPYVKTQWYYNRAFTGDTDLRFRQTFFWRDDDGFGTTSRGDLAWGIDEVNVLRWEAVGTVSEATENLRWYVGQTWYRLLGNDTAFSLLGFVRGETGAEVELQEYGLNFIWRRPFTRDWIHLSMGPSVTWPRFMAGEKREMSLGFGAWIEMEFGDWVYR